MKLLPLSDKVIIRPATVEAVTHSGIIIPDTAKEKPMRGEVLAVGPGNENEKTVLKAGETVLFSKYAGIEINVDGEKLLIMRESDIVAVV